MPFDLQRVCLFMYQRHSLYMCVCVYIYVPAVFLSIFSINRDYVRNQVYVMEFYNVDLMFFVK